MEIRNINFFRIIFKYMISFYMAPFLLEKGFEIIDIGIIYLLGNLLSLLISFIGGYLNDKLNNKLILASTLFVLAITYLSIPFAPKEVLFIIVPINIAGFELSTISANSYLMKKTKQQKKIVDFNLFSFLAVAIGYLIGSLIIDKFSFDLLFIVLSILFFGLTLFSFFRLEDKIINMKKNDMFLKKIKKKKMVFFLLMWMIFALHFGVERVAYVNYLKQNLGLSFIQTGMFLSLSVVFMAITQFILLKNKEIENKLVVQLLFFGSFLSGIGHIILTNPNMIIAFAGRAIHEIGDSLVIGLILVICSNLFESHETGRINGIIRLIAILGTGIGAYISGFMIQTNQYFVPILVSGIMNLIISLFYFVYRGKKA